MTLTVECGWTFLRALVVGTLALALAHPVCALIANAPRRSRPAAWFLLVVPYLTPVVLVGYAYSNFAFSLVHHPFLNELLYGVLLVVKLCPVAALALYFAPAGMSREALHCRRLLPGGSARERAAFFVHGPACKECVAFAVVFLFAFAEFDMASLLNATAWTVSLFDAQAGGLALSESLRLAAWPMVCEGALLLAVMTVLFGRRRPAPLLLERPKTPRPAVRRLTWLYLVFASVLAAAVPMAVVLRGTLSGFAVLAENPALVADVAASVVFAGCAALVAYVAAGWFSARAGEAVRARGRLFLAFLFSVPGLLGALLLALIVLGLFQFTALRTVYDTPLPVVVTLTLLLFPFAALLRALLHAFREGESLHAAVMLGESGEPQTRRNARELVWEMKTRGRFLVAALLFTWGYFEVVASALLAPSATTPVFVRLYNLMHYGQIAGLSAMVLVAFAVPFVLFGVTMSTRRLFVRVRTHG